MMILRDHISETVTQSKDTKSIGYLGVISMIFNDFLRF